MRRAGIVIVTWNSAACIDECLRAATARSQHVVVVDNGSVDPTVARVGVHSGVKLIANRSNRGFAAAVNQGVAALDCDAVLLLNPDAVLETPIEPLADACLDPGVAAAAGKLVNRDGSAQAGFTVRRFPTPTTLAFEALGWNALWPSNPINRRYRCADLDLNTAADVEQPAGAFLMLNRKAWSRLGGLDETFHPLWFEDVDLLRRAADQGLRVRYLPDVVARHHGAHSVQQLFLGQRTLYWYDSLLKYASRHFSHLGRCAVCAAVMIGAAARAPVSAWRERSREPFVVHGKVIGTALRRLLRGGRRSTGDSPPALSDEQVTMGAEQ